MNTFSKAEWLHYLSMPGGGYPAWNQSAWRFVICLPESRVLGLRSWRTSGCQAWGEVCTPKPALSSWQSWVMPLAPPDTPLPQGDKQSHSACSPLKPSSQLFPPIFCTMRTLVKIEWSRDGWWGCPRGSVHACNATELNIYQWLRWQLLYYAYLTNSEE